MAQKRMFDKSIIENDFFMDLPLGAKALYFLLGMEADDEGFVSPKRVMKLYGGSDDDLKILIMKNFVIRFESGVIVITDRKENNWLDKRRIKETHYKLEKSTLKLDGTKYVLKDNVDTAKQPLSIGSVRREEKRTEENNKTTNFNNTENNIKAEEKQKPSIKKNIDDMLSLGEIPAEYQPHLEAFINYWSETDKKGNEKRTKEGTRNVIGRLSRRKRNSETQFGRKPIINIDYEKLEHFDKQMSVDVQPIKDWFSKKYGTERQQKYSETKQLWKQSPLYLKN